MARQASLRVIALVLAAGAAVACSSQTFDPAPANLKGQYSINITNGANACQFANWQEGAQTSNIGFALSQTNTSLAGTVQGAAGIYLQLVAGTDTFTGTISGVTFSLSAAGRNYKDPGCTYNVVAVIDGKQVGKDGVEGTITYKYINAVGASCGIKATACTSVQNFNGSRPPT